MSIYYWASVADGGTSNKSKSVQCLMVAVMFHAIGYPMVLQCQCWTKVYDAGPVLSQHRRHVLCCGILLTVYKHCAHYVDFEPIVVHFISNHMTAYHTVVTNRSTARIVTKFDHQQSPKGAVKMKYSSNKSN